MHIQELLLFIYLFVNTWLLHELMHIKSQGLRTTGVIFVKKVGFEADSDKTINDQWMRFAGGILASIVTFAVLILSGFTPFTFALITCGWMQLIYGIYEGFTPNNEQLVRYGIYAGVFLFWLIIWVI